MYIYRGDTLLHVAAGAYDAALARALIARGADTRARDRMGAGPLHTAAMGMPGSPRWNPAAQAATIALLMASGANPDVADKHGAAPLHRAVRTRCAAAVKALLEGGADPFRKNKMGSTPMFLATRDTGRGGGGSPEAREQQREILALLAARQAL